MMMSVSKAAHFVVHTGKQVSDNRLRIYEQEIDVYHFRVRFVLDRQIKVTTEHICHASSLIKSKPISMCSVIFSIGQPCAYTWIEKKKKKNSSFSLSPSSVVERFLTNEKDA
jgi:hypothetical protein